MIRTFVTGIAATITLLLAVSGFVAEPLQAHGLGPGDGDVFFRRYRGDDEVSAEDRGGNRSTNGTRDIGRAPDRGLESSPGGGGKGTDSRGGGKSGSDKGNGYGRPNPNDFEDRFGP